MWRKINHKCYLKGEDPLGISVYMAIMSKICYVAIVL